MEQKYIYVILTRPRSIVSNLIHMVTKDTYTHAAISFDKELNHMYSFGRKHSYNPLVGRFKKEELDDGLYKRCKSLPGVIIEIEVTQDQYDKAQTLLSQFLSHPEKYKYNYLGLIDNLLNKPVCRENRFVCSEFVYHILSESGIVDLRKPRNLVRPQNLLQVDENIFYKGDLKQAEWITLPDVTDGSTAKWLSMI